MKKNIELLYENISDIGTKKRLTELLKGYNNIKNVKDKKDIRKVKELLPLHYQYEEEISENDNTNGVD
jgi:hypothetical protein